jgi:cyclic beta-1,2-glucan synthetase
VLQPRVTASLPVGREGSLFQRVFSSMTGIDPYDAAVSDVYQDLFGEGSYSGKGIYDVDAFEATLSGRVPDDTLLSHDLFEGTFARAGLVTDIEVVEEFPARYDVAATRSHRWARGDWQLLPWLLGRRDAAGRDSGRLPLIAGWKMLDNLRRSLSAPALVAALVAGWLLPPDAALRWTGFILATIALPALLPILSTLAPRRRGLVARSHLRALGDDLAIALLQVGLGIVFLAHQAWLMGDAILRTLFRLTASRRDLLEWTTAAQVALDRSRRRRRAVPVHGGQRRRRRRDARRRRGRGRPVGVHRTAVRRAVVRGAPARPLVQPVPGRRRPLPTSAADALALRRIARRTWRYFETFVTPEDNDLPPDNFQEDPVPTVAHRTSPTNLGLYLLCVVSARDFGWIATPDAARRLGQTLATMRRLARYRGHFYNWYDTRDLRPLEPAYVSSVDSGNLAAHLVAVASACDEWAGSGPDADAVRAGLG